jgi:integrase
MHINQQADNAKIQPNNDDMFTIRHFVTSFESHLTVQCKLGQLRPATLNFYKNQLKKLVKAVGDFPAASLRAEHLVSCDLNNHFVRVLKSLYRWGVDDDVSLVPKNPFSKLKTPRCGQRTRTLTNEEFIRLLRAASPAFRFLLRVSLRTGARPGELRGLRWSQVDLDARVFTLTKFKAQDKRKDHKSVRCIALSRKLVRVINFVKWKRNPKPDDFVFVNTKGKPWSENAFRCAFRQARKAAGLVDGGETVVLYTLRHSFATTATRNGVSGKVLAEMLGHTSTKMTERYQHLVAEDLVRDIDKATA